MITIEERRTAREAIEKIAELESQIEFCLERKVTLPYRVAVLVEKLTGTGELDRQYEMLQDFKEKTIEAYRERLRSSARDSLSCFAEYLNMDEPPALHHDFLCDHLERVERREPGHMRIIINMPPGHAKSTYGSHLFPAWYLGRHSNHKFIQAGHSQDFVENEFGKRVRAIIDSEDYREIFPDIKLSNASKAAGAFQLAGKLGRYLARGVGQGISGYRGNVAVIDDPYSSRKDADSALKRKEVQDWLMADVTTRLLPKSPMIIIATRWHPLDICGVLEENTKNGIGMPWNIINLPAISEGYDDPLGRLPGEALWPDFYTIDDLLEKKVALASRDWNALYMGRPVDEDGGAIKYSWFKRFGTPFSCPDIRRTTLSVDTAIKDGERNDYTVITVWQECTNGEHHLIHVHRERLQFEPMSAKINEVATTFDVDTILVEDKGSGSQYIQVWSGKLGIPIIPIEVSNVSKEFRFDGVTPMFEAGLVCLPEKATWLPDYERELLQFPNAAHDDQVDATSQYLAWARKGRKLGTKKLTGMNTMVELPDIEKATIGEGSSLVHRLTGALYKGRFPLTLQSTPSAKIGG